MMKNRVNCWKPTLAIVASMVISSQAMGSAISTMEGSETRLVSSASNKPTQERPTSQVDEDIVRHSVEMQRASLNSSQETVVRNTTYKMDHIRFWKAIPKVPAYNTVEEFNQIQSYGENPDAGFIDEGDLPESDDASFERKFAVVKYMGTTRKVTHVNLASLAA